MCLSHVGLANGDGTGSQGRGEGQLDFEIMGWHFAVSHTGWYEWTRPRFDEDEPVPEHNVDGATSVASGA